MSGRPTQFHGVPLEERATDGKGNRLPWSLEYHQDHPLASRGQKRHVEERGPFGKSTRRRSFTRTRTATPAKKENPALDGFEQALKYDAKRATEAQEELEPTSRASNDGKIAPHYTPSHTKQPTQIIIYGYSPSTQYAAIDCYEKISGGIMCEDYPREAPAELQKYPNTFSQSRSVHPRPLNQREQSMAAQYAGGECWVKLTCDSAEAADRAVEQSPVLVRGHWVYAEIYQGKEPESDQPIPLRDEDRQRGSLGGLKPPRKTSHTLSAAFSQHATTQRRATTTLPRSFNFAAAQADHHQPNTAASSSPSTASSATATNTDNPNLRNRHVLGSIENVNSADTPPLVQGQYDPRMMRHFQDRPRYILRPASEAFLSQPTWLDRQLQWVTDSGVLPRNIIGNGPSLDDKGGFNWASASWYWRVCYWVDTNLGSDLCGLKDI